MGWMSKPKKPEASAEEVGLARDSAIAFNDYQERYVPVENDYIQRIKATRGDIQQAGGIGNADAQQAAAGGDLTQVQNGMSNGVAPNSGRAVMARAGIAAARGGGASEVIATRVQDRKNQELAGMLKMTAFGRGLSDQNRIATSQAGYDATQKSIGDMQAKMASDMAMQDLAGTAVGMGVQYGGQWNTANQAATAAAQKRVVTPSYSGEHV